MGTILKKYLFYYFFHSNVISGGMGTRNPGFGYQWVPRTRVLGIHNILEKWIIEDKSNKAFLHFCLCCAAPLWKIIKYGKTLAKNEEKPGSTFLKHPFHHSTEGGTRNPAFEYPFAFHHYSIRLSISDWISNRNFRRTMCRVEISITGIEGTW